MVRLDPAEIRGEGGEHDPRLIMPIKIELYQQPRERQIVIIRLAASLHLDQTGQAPSHVNQFASKVSYDLLNDMAICSTSGGSNNRPLDLCFNLTHAQLKSLENMRHKPDKFLHLRLDPVIAWNKHRGNLDSQPYGGDSTLGEGGWDIGVGMFSDFAFFWLAKIETLSFSLSAMDWVKKIYPGMGYDHFRLIEVKLPTSNALVPTEAIEHFKQAKQDYDNGAHTECVMKLRLAHEAIEKYLKVQSHDFGKAVAKTLGWTSGSEQERFLDGAWKALYIIACASHHTPSVKSLLPADAHVVLISTAALLEYVAQLE